MKYSQTVLVAIVGGAALVSAVPTPARNPATEVKEPVAGQVAAGTQQHHHHPDASKVEEAPVDRTHGHTKLRKHVAEESGKLGGRDLDEFFARALNDDLVERAPTAEAPAAAGTQQHHHHHPDASRVEEAHGHTKLHKHVAEESGKLSGRDLAEYLYDLVGRAPTAEAPAAAGTQQHHHHHPDASRVEEAHEHTKLHKHVAGESGRLGGRDLAEYLYDLVERAPTAEAPAAAGTEQHHHHHPDAFRADEAHGHTKLHKHVAEESGKLSGRDLAEYLYDLVERAPTAEAPAAGTQQHHHHHPDASRVEEAHEHTKLHKHVTGESGRLGGRDLAEYLYDLVQRAPTAEAPAAAGTQQHHHHHPDSSRVEEAHGHTKLHKHVAGESGKSSTVAVRDFFGGLAKSFDVEPKKKAATTSHKSAHKEVVQPETAKPVGSASTPEAPTTHHAHDQSTHRQHQSASAPTTEAASQKPLHQESAPTLATRYFDEEEELLARDFLDALEAVKKTVGPRDIFDELDVRGFADFDVDELD